MSMSDISDTARRIKSENPDERMRNSASFSGSLKRKMKSQRRKETHI